MRNAEAVTCAPVSNRLAPLRFHKPPVPHKPNRNAPYAA